MRIRLISLVAGALLLAVPAASSGSAGDLYAFGDNHFGQLGNATNTGTTQPNPTPALVTLPGATGQVVQVAGGVEHSLALTSTGQVFAFGENNYGQLGYGTNSGTANPNPPTQVSLPGAGGPVVRIAAGTWHSFALTSTGQLYGFGDNEYGELGDATTTGTVNPVPALEQISGARGQVVQVAAGGAHSLALTAGGQLFAFGENNFGQLGYATNSGTGNPNPPREVTLPGANGQIVRIAAGAEHSLALTSTGQLYAFGDDDKGQLGNPATSGSLGAHPTPTLVALPAGSGQVVQIAAGNYHSLALTATGQVYAFGYNFMGQLGNATNTGTGNANPTPAPVVLPGAGGPVVQIAAGNLHSFALTSAGRLYAFGSNYSGQLGNPVNSGLLNANPFPAPVEIGGATLDTVGAGPGTSHSLAVIANLAVATPSLPAGTTGASYAAEPQASGGLPPYQWSASGLPPGVAIDTSSGAVAGTPTATGSYPATISVTDSHGIVASRAFSVEIAGPSTRNPPPLERPAVSLQRAQLRAKFRRSRPHGATALSFSGRLGGAAAQRLTVTLTGPMRPRGGLRTVSVGTFTAPAGALSWRIALGRSIAARLLPGRYTVKLTAPGVTEGSLRLRLASPPEGVVLSKRISTTRRGSNVLGVTRTKRLWAGFEFASGAFPQRRLTVAWYPPHRRTALGVFPARAPKVLSYWANPHGLAKGRWRAVLKAGKTVVESVTARVG